MKIYFNSSFQEIERVNDDLFVKGNTGNSLEAYFDDVDLKQTNINIRLVIEWADKTSTKELPMNKSFNRKYVYINLPALLESGEASFTLRIYDDDNVVDGKPTLLQTAIFTRKILASVDESDKTSITNDEYLTLLKSIENLNNAQEIILTNVDDKPTLMTKEELDILNEVTWQSKLSEAINQLEQLADNNLFEITGLEGFDLEEYYTTIANIKSDISSISSKFINYYTKSELSSYLSKIENNSTKISDLTDRVVVLETSGGSGGGGSSETGDLSDYFTKEQSMAVFATKTNLEQSLEDFYTKTYIDATFAGLDYVNTQVGQFYPKVYMDSVFATKNELTSAKAEINEETFATALTYFYTKEQTYSKSQVDASIADSLNEGRGYTNTQVTSLTDVYIPNLYYTKEWINTKVNNIYDDIKSYDANNLSKAQGYTNEQLDSLRDTYIPYLYYNKTEVNDLIASVGGGSGGTTSTSYNMAEQLFSGSTTSTTFSGYSPSRGGMIIVNGRLTAEDEGYGDFQFVIPIYATSGTITLSQCVYGYESASGTRVTIMFSLGAGSIRITVGSAIITSAYQVY